MSEVGHVSRVTIYDRFGFEDEPPMPPENMIEFIAWAQAHLESIPEPYRAKATILIGSNATVHGDTYPTIEIGYEEPA